MSRSLGTTSDVDASYEDFLTKMFSLQDPYPTVLPFTVETGRTNIAFVDLITNIALLACTEIEDCRVNLNDPSFRRAISDLAECNAGHPYTGAHIQNDVWMPRRNALATLFWRLIKPPNNMNMDIIDAILLWENAFPVPQEYLHFTRR